MNGPHESSSSGAVPDRRPDLDEKARERAIRNERAGPETFVDLALRKCFGPPFQKHLEEPKSLGREMNVLASD
jgi:hypothetical protein